MTVLLEKAPQPVGVVIVAVGQHRKLHPGQIHSQAGGVVGKAAGGAGIQQDAPGVGKKLAQRILLELKDKLGGAAPAEGGISLPAGDVPAASGSALALAQAALAELGYRPQEITAALRSFEPEGMKTEEIVRQCLRAMVMR